MRGGAGGGVPEPKTFVHLRRPKSICPFEKFPFLPPQDLGPGGCYWSCVKTPRRMGSIVGVGVQLTTACLSSRDLFAVAVMRGRKFSTRNMSLTVSDGIVPLPLGLPALQTLLSWARLCAGARRRRRVRPPPFGGGGHVVSRHPPPHVHRKTAQGDPCGYRCRFLRPFWCASGSCNGHGTAHRLHCTVPDMGPPPNKNKNRQLRGPSEWCAPLPPSFDPPPPAHPQKCTCVMRWGVKGNPPPSAGIGRGAEGQQQHL